MKILTDDVVSRYIGAKPCVRNSRALVNVIASELGLSVPKTRSLLMQAGVYVTDDRKIGEGSKPNLSGLTREENLALLDKALRRTRAHTAEDRATMAKRYCFDESVVFNRMKEVRKIDDAASARKTFLAVSVTILLFLAVSGLTWSYIQNYQPPLKPEMENTPQGKRKYVNEEIRRYEEYCASSDDC